MEGRKGHTELFVWHLPEDVTEFLAEKILTIRGAKAFLAGNRLSATLAIKPLPFPEILPSKNQQEEVVCLQMPKLQRLRLANSLCTQPFGASIERVARIGTCFPRFLVM